MTVTSFSQTPAFQHACTFAKDGKLTDESIQARQIEFGDLGLIADFRRWAVLSAAGNDPTVEHICTFANRARSGIWNTDGTLNQGRLKELKDRSIPLVNGTLLVTRSLFQSFINERRALENRGVLPNALELGNLTWVKPHAYCPIKIPVPFTAVTDGSVDAFFNTYADWVYKGEKAVTWEIVSKFYDPENTAQLR